VLVPAAAAVANQYLGDYFAVFFVAAVAAFGHRVLFAIVSAVVGAQNERGSCYLSIFVEGGGCLSRFSLLLKQTVLVL
jgi:hypothetical protein